MFTVGLFIPYISVLDFFILIHCLVNCSLNDLLEAGHVGTLDTENVFLMYLHKNNNLADKEFVGYNIFSSKILQA